ncbi:MAG: hypothetical protein AAGC55_18045, partial [Myxococcota bacterium]
MLITIAGLALSGPGCGSSDSDGGSSDSDAGGQPDPAPDADGDLISDEDEGRPNNVDTDADGTPDWQDLDSDNDTIADRQEAQADTDGDGVPNVRDTDSDGDCRLDEVEAGDNDLDTPPINSDGEPDGEDYLDLDADNDGLADWIEDPNCNGVRDDDETDSFSADTDNDGVSDLIEEAAGTDPNDENDNPRELGDFVFVVPFEEAPSPGSDDLDFSTNLKAVDVYFLIDRSGSMQEELNNLRGNINTVLSNLTCAKGQEENCIPDLWAGVGGIGYPGTGGLPFTHVLSVQPDPIVVRDALGVEGPGDPLGEPGCTPGSADRPCDEITQASLWSAAKGLGSLAAEAEFGASCGLSVVEDYADAPSCETSAAGPGGISYPCFRPDALPVIIYATDESSAVTVNCPRIPSVIDAANEIGAKLVGLAGADSGANVFNDMRTMATGTETIDITTPDREPLFINVEDDSQTGARLQEAITILANGVPLDLAALA